MLAAAKRAFLPEFLNRIDEIVVFEPLTEEQVAQIGELICAPGSPTGCAMSAASSSRSSRR